MTQPYRCAAGVRFAFRGAFVSMARSRFESGALWRSETTFSEDK